MRVFRLAFADLNFSSTGTWGTVLIGTEENSSGIATLARTTSRGPCFLLSGNFLVEADLRFLPEAQKGLEFFRLIFIHVPF